MNLILLVEGRRRGGGVKMKEGRREERVKRGGTTVLFWRRRGPSKVRVGIRSGVCGRVSGEGGGRYTGNPE